ncbi:MAG: aspartate aminotransferase family protein [Chloroflexi bacterium]|nr:aspartate aminotransferase family protein [Chloroflexota bacterium]
MTQAQTDIALEPWWMPFTANAAYKSDPRMLAKASGVYYETPEGRRILDGVSGLWCVNAGHCRPEIVEAISRQAAEMDYAPSFQMGHPIAFEFAERLRSFAPDHIENVFFSNSGSEAVDTALKIARAYHRANGEPDRTVLVGRERGYHGAGFGGTAVGGLDPHKVAFTPLVPDVAHLPTTHGLEVNRFSRGQPQHGAELADGLETVISEHGESRIAAVIVEPVSGAAGVLVPPVGYLERLAAICKEHGILLIFDEVITGFGRLGARFAAERFGLRPDMMTIAKGLTNGSVPMAATLLRGGIYDTVVAAGDGIELPHGYTYSGHPLACAAGLATLSIHESERLWERAAALAPAFEDKLHSLASAPHVIDVRNLGLMGAIELDPIDGRLGERAQAIFRRCFEAGVLIRITGDTIALAPALVFEEDQLDVLFGVVGEALESQ